MTSDDYSEETYLKMNETKYIFHRLPIDGTTQDCWDLMTREVHELAESFEWKLKTIGGVDVDITLQPSLDVDGEPIFLYKGELEGELWEPTVPWRDIIPWNTTNACTHVYNGKEIKAYEEIFGF